MFCGQLLIGDGDGARPRNSRWVGSLDDQIGQILLKVTAELRGAGKRGLFRADPSQPALSASKATMFRVSRLNSTATRWTSALPSRYLAA